jgi:hypothetical protein
MKQFSSITWLGALACAAILVTPAQAGCNFRADTKHGSFHLAQSRYVANYDKFAWLSPHGDPSDLSVDHIVVSLAEQHLYVYHGAQLLAWSNISSGRAGYETPVGDYVVSQKDVDHHSNLFQNAPMPFFMRLSDAGLGLHAGFLPGYPASHGCVRMPYEMARELYPRVAPGTSVRITGGSVSAALAAIKAAPSLSRL